METSVSMKTIDTSGKKNSTTLSYVNPNASNADLKEYAERLASLTADTYEGATKITKTNLDEEEPTKVARTGYILDSANGTTLTTAVNVNTLGAYDYNNDNQLFGFNFTGDNAPIHVITGPDFQTDRIMLTAPVSPPPAQQPNGCQHPFTIALMLAGETVSGDNTATLRVEETATYQALDVVITITGGEG